MHTARKGCEQIQEMKNMAELYDQNKENTDGGEEEKKYADYYTKLRAEADSRLEAHGMQGLGKLAACIPDFFYLIWKLSGDPAVPAANKGQLLAALVYFLLPIDVIPDALPVLGHLDDLYFALIVINNLLTSVDVSVLQKYWLGDEDILLSIKNALELINEKVGLKALPKIVTKIKKYLAK